MRRRPCVSAKKPHRCDEHIIPIYGIPAKIPFCRVVKFKSHSDTGKMNASAPDSNTAVTIVMPLTMISK